MAFGLLGNWRPKWKLQAKQMGVCDTKNLEKATATVKTKTNCTKSISYYENLLNIYIYICSQGYAANPKKNL